MSFFPPRPRPLSLRLLLTVPFVVQLVGVVGLVGYLSFKNGQQAVENIANQVIEQATLRIRDRLDVQLQIQQHAVSLGQADVQQGRLNVNNRQQLQGYLWRQLTLLPQLGTVQFVDPQGRQLGYERLSNSSKMQAVERSSGHSLEVDAIYQLEVQPGANSTQIYTLVDAGGSPLAHTHSLAIDQGVQAQHPYAQAPRQQTWAEIFVDPLASTLQLSALAPITDATGNAAGILSTSVALPTLSAFLKTLDAAPQGQSFIIERSGHLVATSTLEPLVSGDGANSSRVPISQSQNPQTRAIARQLTAYPGGLNAIQTSQSLTIDAEGDRLFAQVVPYQDRYGLDWLLVVSIPESVLIDTIQRNTNTTIGLCIIAAIASASFSLLLARWITRALRDANLAAENLAQGRFSQPIQTNPIIEVNELGQSFNNMARQLLASQNQLEDCNRLLELQFDTFFKLAPVGMAILDSQLRYVQVNDILATINGPSVAEHLGRTIAEVLPDLAPLVVPLYRQVLETGIPLPHQEVSGTVPSQPGVTRQWLCSYFPLDGVNGRPTKVGIVLVEISKIKRVEEALRVSEQKFSTIFHVSPDPAWIATFPEGQCLNINDRLCKFLGYSREEMVGQPCKLFSQWAKPEHADWFQTQLRQNGSVEEFETVFHTRTGEPRTVLLSAQVRRLEAQDCIIGVLKDISDRKQAEAVLQQSEAQIRAILEAIPDLIMRIDRQGFYRGYVRTNSLIDLIPTESDPVGHHLSEYPLPERGARQLRAIQHVLDTGEMQVYEQEMVFEDRTQYEEIRIVVYNADEVLVLIRDITDRKQLELALQESQTRLSDILNRAIAAIVSYRLYDDLANAASRYHDHGYSAANWSYEFCSSGCERVFGYTPDELMANPPLWYEHVHPEDWQQVLLPRYTQLMAGQAITSEYRFLHRDGTWHWISETAACRRDETTHSWIITIVSHDISDRKRSEEKLRYSEAALAKAQSIAQMGSWEFDPTTQQITWSEELFRIYGLDPSQPAPDYTDFLQQLPPSDRQRLQDCVYQALTTGQSYEIEHQFCRTDGMIGWMFGRGEVSYNEQGQVIKLFGTGQEITARKHIELELQQSKEAAEAANRSKSLFLANISHELRTPLNAILGFAELMSFDPNLNPDQRENLSIIRRSGDHLLNLINDVLDLSKIEAGHMLLEERVVVVAALLAELQQLFQPQASDRGIQLSFHSSANVPPAVILDERKLRQILINLLGNALKFTPQGRVTVRLSTVSLANQATPDPAAISQVTPNQSSLAASPTVASHPIASPPIASHPQTESVQLLWEIEDTGVGIAPNELDRIFEAFAQAQAGRQTEQGTGLGLAISQRFARLMGGNLSVRSAVGQGSTFTLQTPGRMVEEAIATPTAFNRQRIQLAPGQPTYRILVVDDHPLNRRLLIKLLFRAGLEVKVAADGQAAVQIWQSWSPHLIWMDLRMPNVDGYQATEQIRAAEQMRSTETPNPPPRTVIIALTAQAFSDERDRVLSLGCDDYVTKPVQEAVLFAKMGKHLGLQYETHT